MGKKLNALTRGLTDNHLALSVKDSAQQVWLAGIGACALVEEEGGKAFSTLVKEGGIIQARALKLTDKKIAIVASKTTDTLGRLEHAFEVRVASTLRIFGVASKRDINALSRNVAELSAVIRELDEGKMAQRRVAGRPG